MHAELADYWVGKQKEGSYELLREDLIRFDGDIGMPDMSSGWANLTCEYLARLAYEKHGLKSVCYRPFSGYGEDQDDSYPFPSICKRAIAHIGQPTLTVWGTGEQMRDFIHIEDCVDGAEIQFRGTALSKSERVSIDTIDRFIARTGIVEVDILKVDTQGYDLEVLKGAEASLRSVVIRSVIIELDFCADISWPVFTTTDHGLAFRACVPIGGYLCKTAAAKRTSLV